MPWHVIYTNPKAEKKVADQLAKMGIEVYCPLITRIRQWSDRQKKVEMPLFTSYVFVNVDEKQKNKVFDVKGVVKYIFWLGKPAVVRDDEIGTIKKWLDAGVVDVAVENIRKGDIFEIKDGPFMDHTGLVQEVNRHTIRLMIESIGIVLVINHNNPPK